MNRYSKEDIIAETREIVAEILEITPDSIQMESHFVKDLNAESMDLLEIISTVARKYRVRILPERMKELYNLSKISEFVKEILKENPPTPQE